MNRMGPPEQGFKTDQGLGIQFHNGLEPWTQTSGLYRRMKVAFDRLAALEFPVEFGIEQAKFVPATTLGRVKGDIRPQQHFRQPRPFSQVYSYACTDPDRSDLRIRAGNFGYDIGCEVTGRKRIPE